MTNEMRMNGVKARFEERANTKDMKDSLKLATQADLYRLADETSTVICMLADAMDHGRRWPGLAGLRAGHGAGGPARAGADGGHAAGALRIRV